MVDTGASLNYMSPETVQTLGLKRETGKARVVVLANGQEVKTNNFVCTEFIIEAEETSGPERSLFCAKCGA